MKPWHVEICDVTLRDGEQTPGVSFTLEEKQDIARRLDAIGIEVIEAGFPIVSIHEKEIVRSISRMGLDAKICGLSRACREDVDAALDAEVDMIGLFVATSDLHIKHKYKKSREEVVANALAQCDYAVDHGLIVRFGAEDASRTELPVLIDVYRQAAEHKASYVTYADTTGRLTPLEVATIIPELVEKVPVPIAMHSHNDLGCATANTIIAAELGAYQLHTTVNGLGERAGNARLEEVLVTLALKGGIDRYDMTQIPTLSANIQQYTGILMPATKPVVGANAFAHESGIHIAAILENPETYEYIPPSLLGLDRQFILGKHTGKRALTHILTTFGYQLPDDQIVQVLEDIKEQSEGKCTITPQVLRNIIRNVTGEEINNGNSVREDTRCTGRKF
ncbi:MAG: homocitrate synthase family protein [Methanospirillum sp.]|uniref:homocitrate synthase family protein n=1 Tax=Methanospirillum sp. TaxID=45200 RepID=UPI00236B870E|nr:homocitrate synthase family protein [Methanospirillum sp.]MDD1728072.1 homocitrate synthase family protein [Methanospirillum sp.]